MRRAGIVAARFLTDALRACIGFAKLLPALLALLVAAAQVQSEPVSFAGKQIKLMIGYSPTGYGYDTYGRLIARHLGKYLAGNPAIIPQNRPVRAHSISPTISITPQPGMAPRSRSSAAA
jgi:hypothetical protein